VNLEIFPQPDDAERAAIAAVLEAEAKEERDPSPWANAALPQRQAETDSGP
jgi:hypothetical protein